MDRRDNDDFFEMFGKEVEDAFSMFDKLLNIFQFGAFDEQEQIREREQSSLRDQVLNPRHQTLQHNNDFQRPSSIFSRAQTTKLSPLQSALLIHNPTLNIFGDLPSNLMKKQIRYHSLLESIAPKQSSKSLPMTPLPHPPPSFQNQQRPNSIFQSSSTSTSIISLPDGSRQITTRKTIGGKTTTEIKIIHPNGIEEIVLQS